MCVCVCANFSDGQSVVSLKLVLLFYLGCGHPPSKKEELEPVDSTVEFN